jgi:hypothetical protein
MCAGTSRPRTRRRTGVAAADEAARAGVRGRRSGRPSPSPDALSRLVTEETPMVDTAVPSDLVLAAVRACSTSAGSDRTIHRLLEGTRRAEPVAGSGATRPVRTASSA